MTNTDALVTIREHLAKFGHTGLILPSGWFGRPYDNLLQLTRIEASDQSLLIELDGRIVLTFTGELHVAAIELGLRISGFTVLSCDWTEFGSAESHHQEFLAGTVELVAPVQPVVPALICIRRTERRGRKHWFLRGYNDWYELRLDDGPIEALNALALFERLRAMEEWNMVDFLECESQASRAFREGDREAWIIFPDGCTRSAASS